MKLFLIFYLSFIGLLFPEQSKSYTEALELYKNGKYEDSINLIRQSTQMDKPTYDLYYLAAHNYWKLNDVKNASDNLYFAMKINPARVEPFIELIKFNYSASRFKGALEICESGIKKFPNNIELKLQYALILLRFNKTVSALDTIENLKNSYSDDYRPLSVEANIYYQMRNFEKAEISLKWAMTLAPNNPFLNNNLALIYEGYAIDYLKTGDKEKAKINLDLANSQVQKAIQLDKSKSIIFQENQKRISKSLQNL